MNDLLAFGIHHWREGAGRRGAQRRYTQESAAAHGGGADMRTVAWRGTTQPSSQKGGAEMDAENNLCGVENVGDKGEGAAATAGCAGEDGAAEAQCIFRRGISYNLSLCFL